MSNALLTPASPAQTPVFEVSVLATNIAFTVRVNDQPVLRMPVGRVETTFDVNPYIEQGDNVLSLTVEPRVRGRDFPDNASAVVRIQRKESPGAEAFDTLGTLVFSGFGTQAITGFERSTAVGLPVAVERFGARGTLHFQAEGPLGDWGWARAETLVPTEALRTEVVSEMRRIHELLSRREAGSLAQRCHLQAEDFRRAYYLSSLAEAQQLLGISQLLSDATIEVEPFPEGMLTMEILGGGRLVEVLDPEAKSPLRLRSSEAPDMVGRFQCVLCKLDGAWQIAR